MSRYQLPEEIQIEADGPVRIIRLNRPEQLNATNHVLHAGLAELWPQLDADEEARVAVITGNGRAFSRAATSPTSTSWSATAGCGPRASPTAARS